MASKKENISALTNIKKAIGLIDESKRMLALKLLDRVEFMEKTLLELEAIIKKDGAVLCTTNGNGFEILSEHPAQKSYNVMIGKYNAMVKTLLDLIPEGKSEGDELMNFLGRGNK